MTVHLCRPSPDTWGCIHGRIQPWISGKSLLEGGRKHFSAGCALHHWPRLISQSRLAHLGVGGEGRSAGLRSCRWAARGLGGKGEAQASLQPLSLAFPSPLPHGWLISCNWQAHCSLGLRGEVGVCEGVVLIYTCLQGHLSLMLAPGLT